MNMAVLPNGVTYNIPLADMTFFKELAARMKWEIVDNVKRPAQASTRKSWVDTFAGKWQDTRSTSQIIKDIHSARTTNPEITL